MNLFNSIRVRAPKRNKFNLSHDVKMSCDIGQLIPFICQDIIPGDTFKCNSEVLIRFAPLIAPLMHRVNVYTHFFFVPKRLVWNNWQKFITGGTDGTLGIPNVDDETIPEYPRIVIRNNRGNIFPDDGNHVKNNYNVGTLADYLGFPVLPNYEGSSSVTVDALPFRAYQLIYNEYYRDQNLTDPVDIGNYADFDGERSDAWYVNALCELRYRCWEKDYFTSALPWPQRGDAVELPLYGNADVRLDMYNGGSPHFEQMSNLNPTGSLSQSKPVSSSSAQINMSGSSEKMYFNPDGTLKVDMSNVSAATINELRQAVKAQEFLELGARGGSRYIEQIMAYFGVKSSDARLQRPEYLGGGKAPIVIS